MYKYGKNFRKKTPSEKNTKKPHKQKHQKKKPPSEKNTKKPPREKITGTSQQNSQE
jgi:hypothetical protein